ncbi:YetF domain-containing protein [Sporomusa acidovorans]|uniref:YetF domain-containing protein n=1 Tax=Sporomusa acidovorans TaxID=112900 RepID=UPI000B83499E|nr:DUF421 domain-containing protein [Sporomusa acidovorans]
MEDIMDIVIRTSLGFVILFILTHIAGRKAVSQLTFFDYVNGITIGSIAAAMAVDSSIGMVAGVVSLGVWTVWIMIINFITLKSVPARKLIDSEPIMVIHNGKILEDNLGKRYFNVHHLLKQLRMRGVFDPNEIEVGIMESNGHLSILKKAQFQPVTAKDLNLSSRGAAASQFVGKELVVDGTVIEKNLTESGLTRQWLESQLQSQGVTDLNEVTLATINPDGTLYVDKKSDQAPLNQHVKK